MAMNFPSSPAIGQPYSVSGGPTYTWDGNVWKVLTPGQQYSPQVFTATAGQTTFTVSGGYVIGAIDVFRNGVKLVNGQDFTATDLATVVLSNACSAGDTVEVIKLAQILYTDALKASSNLSDVSNAATARSNLGAVSKTGDTITGNVNISTGNTGGTVLNLTNSSTGGGSWNLYSSGAANGEGAGKLLVMKDGLGVAQQIDGSGRVTMPYQVAFHAYNASTGDPVKWASAPLNRGSNYNASTGKFTAPISGTYLFYCGIHGSSSDGRTADYRLRINNGDYSGGACRVDSWYAQATSIAVVYLSAGDYVHITAYVPFTNSAALSYFGGYLLG